MTSHAAGDTPPEGRLLAAIRTWVVAGIAYLAVSVAILGPSLVTRCHTTIAGGPGDNTSGPIWQSWNYLRLGVGPLARHTPLVHAPAGAPLFEPHEVTSVVLIVPMWVVTHLVGPVCSFNVAVLGGFWLNALLTFGLVRWLTKRPLVAFFAGYAFAFTPFHVYKAYGQLGYVSTWAFPLIVWSLLAFWARPSGRRAVLAAASVLLAFYTDGYYLLIVPVTVAAFLAGALLHDRFGGTGPSRIKLRGVLAAGGLVALLSLPIAYTVLTERNAIEGVVDRSKSDLYIYSARPWEWVLPARTHPFFGPRLGQWQDRHLHQSNYSEQTLFPGLTVIALAGGCLVSFLWRRRRPGEDRGPLTVPLPLVVGTMALVAATSLLFSLPPTIRGVPMPSDLVYAVAHFWRVYSRFFISLDLALVVLASVMLAHLVKASARREALLVLVLLPLLAFELLTGSRPQTWSFRDHTPGVYRWLADQPRPSVVAEYPLVPYPSDAHLSYLTFQPIHEHPIFNGAPRGTSGARTESSLFGLGDPQTVPALRALGVDLVVVHPQAYSKFVGTEVDVRSAPPGLVPAFSTGDAVAYRLDRSAAVAMVRLGDGFFGAEGVGWSGKHWMGAAASAEIVPFGGRDGPFVVRFTASSFARPRHLTVVQGDVVLWQGRVDRATPVSFRAPAEGVFRLSASPGARRISDVVPGSPDARSVAVEITRLEVAPAPG